MKRTPTDLNAHLLTNLVLVGVLLISVWRGQAPFDTVIRLPSLLFILVIINTVLLFRGSLFGTEEGGLAGRTTDRRPGHGPKGEIATLRNILNARTVDRDASLPADALGGLLGVSGQAGMSLYMLDEGGAFTQLAACGTLSPQLSAARFVLQNGELRLLHPAGLGDEMLCRWETAPRCFRHASAVTMLSVELMPLSFYGNFRALLVALPGNGGKTIGRHIDPESAALFLESALARWQASIRASEGRALDAQTGLQRAEWFKESFEIEVERSERYHQNLTLMLVDLSPCDDLPAAQRDALRIAVATALRDSLRRLDQAFVGSRPNRFAAILTETNIEVANRVTERVRQAFAAGIATLRGLNPRLAVGIAAYPVDATHGDGLREMAEEALNEAVRNGKPVVAYGEIYMNAGAIPPHSGEKK